MAKRRSRREIISHRLRFSDLETFVNEDELTQDEIHDWVKPYYMAMLGPKITEKLIEPAKLIPKETVARLLGDFNWRTRSIGAMYVALRGLVEFEQQIANLLLKSEVCYAGRTYAHTLASFNTETSISALERYLDYYLQQPKLYFDQSVVMSALIYLDEINGTNRHAEFMEDWNEFVKDKENWGLEASKSWFFDNMSQLVRIKSAVIT